MSIFWCDDCEKFIDSDYYGHNLVAGNNEICDFCEAERQEAMEEGSRILDQMTETFFPTEQDVINQIFSKDSDLKLFI